MEEAESVNGPPLDSKSVAIAEEMSSRWPDDLAVAKKTAATTQHNVDITAWPDDLAAGKQTAATTQRNVDITAWPDDLDASKQTATDTLAHLGQATGDELSARADITAWPDDLAVAKPLLQHLDQQDKAIDNSAAWQLVEEEMMRTAMPPNWDEDVALDPPGCELVRLPRNAQAKVGNVNASTMPLLEPRPGCDLQLWFIAMPGNPPDSGILQQRWVARARYLRVAIASAATQRARLLPVVVFVGMGGTSLLVVRVLHCLHRCSAQPYRPSVHAAAAEVAASQKRDDGQLDPALWGQDDDGGAK